MRRMKIRAKPNFGGGGGTSRTSSGPGRGSAAPVEAQSSKIQITPPPVEEADVSSAATVKCPGGEGGVKETSGTQNISSDVSSVDLQENTNKSPVNITTSASFQMNASQPSLTNVQGIKSFDVIDSGKELQQVVTDNTSESGAAVSPEIESSVTPEPSESHAIPVPSPKAQPLLVPQENSSAATFQIISQSITQTHVDKSVDVSCSGAASPVSDTSSNISRETQQDSDGKSTLCMRRKKLKVKPMLGTVRKGSIIDKAKVKASDSNITVPNMKSECVDVLPSENQTNSEENVSSPENTENNHLNQNMQEKADTDADAGNVSKMCNKKPLEKAELETNVTPESSEFSEGLVCPTEKEVIPIRQEMEIESVLPERTCEDMEVEVVKENTNMDVVVDETSASVGNTLASKTTSHTSAPTAGCKRRARICAKPALITKKKKEDNKGTKVKSVEQITNHKSPDEQLANASTQESITRGCGSEESDTAAVKPNVEISESHQREECKSKPSIASFKKEVKFAEIELNRKHSHLSNISDNNKDSKESEETQKMKREGIHDNVKENVDSPLHSNLKTPRIKKLSENKEIDPELEVLDVNTNVEKQVKKRLKQDKCEEVMNSDDSTGDKENASTAITELPKQERIIKDNCSGITQKAKTKSPVHSSKLFGKFERKHKFEDDGDSPDKKKKQIFRARKDEFRKKMSEGAMERSKMTMFDLIYWNPASNPMPGRTASPKRSTGRGDTDSITSETAEEQQVDDLGLDPADSEHQSRPESPEVVSVSVATPEKPDEENKDSAEEEKDAGEDVDTNEEEASGEKDIFAPRVKIGPNGEIMVDEQSIKIQTTAAKNRDEVLSKAVVVEESGDSSHYGKWSKRRRRSCEWTVKETALFYKALSTVGTDFSLMETLIKWRTRAELKTKFKKEERNNRDLVDLALNDSTQFDMTVFEEESDYDPKEDRKAARQAERAEAKRRRLEMKQQDKIKEMEKKKIANKKKRAAIKNRKKVLRKAYRNRGRKRKETFESDNEDSPSLDDSDSASEDSVLEQPQPEDLVPVKPRVTLKRRLPKRRSSLVISEVTVTMETVKYNEPASKGTTEQLADEQETPEEYIQPASITEENLDDHHGPHEETHPSSSPDNGIPQRSEEFNHHEEQESEINLLNKYPQLPLNEGLPETHIIENMISEDDENVDVENNTNTSQKDDVKSSEPSTSTCKDKNSENIETITELHPCNPVPEPSSDDDGQRVWHFPVSAIQTLEDGRQVILVPTPSGHNSVPVPILPPGTSNVVVMATDVPDSPGELIYHVYVVSPVEAGES
uniref:Myb-like domain-containing protein n=1 Tax=Scylla olivacea TaxID=85551 RepID=A0A0N7ZAC7_SCYOL